MATLFGFEIRRKSIEEKDTQPSFAPETNEDGALVVAAGGAYGTYIDLQGAARTEAELVTKYREMSMHPEVERAVDDVINEAIVIEKNKDIISINLDDVNVADRIKKLIREEFKSILTLMDFNRSAFDIFRRWYIDGRIYYHIIIDVTNPRDGIKELRYVDPRKLRKVREVRRKRDPKSQAVEVKTDHEYFVYNERGFQNKAGEIGTNTATGGLKITPDSIVHVTSGLVDPDSTLVLSHLHKAIKPLNQLRALEDATVIYRISRAPERRIFYIDVGSLPKMKAEQYLRDMMIRHKNRVVYDATTGEVRDDRKFMTMLEDYWFPRREGSRGTEITTLPAGQNLGKMEDVEYFQQQLYMSLNVPPSRLQQDGTFNFGQGDAINRDELKFIKFVDRLRSRFNQIFLTALGKQLILKNIMNTQEWEAIEASIQFDYAKDNYFDELKETSIINSRLGTLGLITPYIGRHYSNEWIRKNILHQSDDDIEEMDEQILAERQNPVYLGVGDEEGDQSNVTTGNGAQPPSTPAGPSVGGVSSVAPGEQFN